MKKLNFLLLTSVLLLANVSCHNNDDEIKIEKTYQEKELIQELEKKYKVEIEKQENVYTYKFSDGRIIKMEYINEDELIITGDTFNNENIKGFRNKDNAEQPYYFEFTSNKDVNEIGVQTEASPCNQHDKNESFNDCFKREMNEFCDGAVGCASLAMSPGIILSIIAAHCTYC